MTHAPHQGTRRVLGDDCDECVARANDLNGLSQLDGHSLRELANLAAQASGKYADPKTFGASHADMKAVETLRLAARIVYRSGIDPDVAA